MKYFIILFLTSNLLAQQIVEVKGENIFISNEALQLSAGKKYKIETQSGTALIGVYKNSDKTNGFVAKVIEGNVNKGDYISKVITSSKTSASSSKKVTSKSYSYNPNKKFRWGVHAGFNSLGVKVVNTTNDTENPIYDPKLGFQAGLVAAYSLNQKITLNTKLSYFIMRAFTDRNLGGGTSMEDGVELNSFAIEPSAQFYLLDFLNIHAGLRVGFLTRLLKYDEDTSTGVGANGFRNEEDWLDEGVAEQRGFDVQSVGVDIPIGIGARFQSGSVSIEPNFTFYIPVGPLARDLNGTGFEVTYNTFAFNVDFLF